MTQRLTYLFEKHLAKTLSADERIELLSLVLDPANEAELTTLLQDAWDESETAGVSQGTRNALLSKLETPMMISIRRKKRWIGWVAAACLAGIIMTGYLLFMGGNDKTDPPVAQGSADVAPPQSNKARVILSDGRSVSIHSLNTVVDGTVIVSKDANGNIIYTGSSEKLTYNTLVNPRGSQVATTTLADGTKVWLNAGSSIKYFASNTGRGRNVEIAGEAYFEVAKDKKRPFIVKKEETSITVFGTHFNVNAYEDEEELKVTLLEGSISVNGTTIKPGQQAIVSSSVRVANNVNLEEVMAWKNGFFRFEGTSIQQVMRQIARWYDVDIIYQSELGDRKLRGDIPRDVKASQVFKMLEETGGAKFRIEGKKVYVTK